MSDIRENLADEQADPERARRATERDEGGRWPVKS
jgi:hypothetical protein